MTPTEITQAYLADLGLSSDSLDIQFLRELQSRHIAKYSFNSLAVVLGQEIPLDLNSVFNKIVTRSRGGYCYEHNKLIHSTLSELHFDVRLLLSKVVHNRDVDVPRTHRITLLKFEGGNYIVDAGFGSMGSRYPVKLELGLEQDQGDACYRIIQTDDDTYGYQILKDGDFFTLYTFDLHQYTDADCSAGHFYSHQHPDAVFVNNLVVSLKSYGDIHSLRNGELHHIHGDHTDITTITDVSVMHQLLTDVFKLDIDSAISEFLFHKFVSDKQ